MEEIAECLELSVEDVDQIAAVQIVQQLLQKAFLAALLCDTEEKYR